MCPPGPFEAARTGWGAAKVFLGEEVLGAPLPVLLVAPRLGGFRAVATATARPQARFLPTGFSLFSHLGLSRLREPGARI